MQGLDRRVASTSGRCAVNQTPARRSVARAQQPCSSSSTPTPTTWLNASALPCRLDLPSCSRRCVVARAASASRVCRACGVRRPQTSIKQPAAMPSIREQDAIACVLRPNAVPVQQVETVAASASAVPPEEQPILAPTVETLDDTASDKAGRTGASGISSGIRLEEVSMTFKNQQVLKSVSWEVKKGERVGLVGVNGAGKTTQLQIIMGRLQPDSGEVIKARRNMRIAYLAQEFDVQPSRTVREEFYSVYDVQMKVKARQEELSQALETVGEDMDRMQEILDELEKLNNKVVDMDVKLLDMKIDQMMPELGFKQDDNDRLVASFSGGWQMRMCLGKLLLQDPDLLLLDEPTNHLDLDAIQWLEGYLRKQEVPMVIVSHDREFLDQLCTKIVETERGVATTYSGNYTQYTLAKSERTALQWAAWEKQQKEIAKLEDMMTRLAGGAQSGRASQAEKELERIKADGLIEKPFVPKRKSFTFPTVEKMGNKVLTIEGLTHGYPRRPLFSNCELEIFKGDRVAIIGPNGAGKSTLLRLIMGREKPQEGVVALGEHNIMPNYFEQNQAEALDLEQTVLDTLIQASPDAKLNDLKALLGRMLFSGLAMEKKVKVLSGGEKARLALAKFMCTNGTLLVLDEPTNHLDIPSKEMLEEAIKNFQGAVIAVSHDRYFLRQVATRVLLVENQKLLDYKGDYEFYLEQNEGEAVKMEEKEAKVREIEKDNIIAKSKMTKAEKERMKKDKAKAFHAQADVKKKK